MQTKHWSLQNAKNKFSEVVNAAGAGEPQVITRGGVPAAVVLSMGDFAKFQEFSKIQQPSFTEYLLDIPTGNSEIEHLDVTPRDFF